MNYIDFETKEKTYKLRLTTRSIVGLEKTLGMNPLKVFSTLKAGSTVEIEHLALILKYAIASSEPEITLDQTYDIFDEWIENGHTYIDFINLTVELFKQTGLIEKN